MDKVAFPIIQNQRVLIRPANYKKKKFFGLNHRISLFFINERSRKIVVILIFKFSELSN